MIYLMRHAEAEAPHAWPGADRTRPLTDDGLASLEAALPHMQRLKLTGELLITSPYERASQTADAVSSGLHILQTIQCPELSAGATVSDFRELLSRFAGASSLWVVGHMPEISIFTSHLTGNPADAEHGFEPGEIAATENGRVVWRRRLQDWKAAT